MHRIHHLLRHRAAKTHLPALGSFGGSPLVLKVTSESELDAVKAGLVRVPTTELPGFPLEDVRILTVTLPEDRVLLITANGMVTLRRL